MSMLLMVQAMSTEVGNAARKLVLLKLADNANDSGQCWPSYETIARHCEMSKRTVMRHIQKLQEDGFVNVTHRKKEDSNENRSNIYTLNLSGDKMTPRIKNGTDKMTPPSDTRSLGVVTHDHQGSDPMSPRTSHRTSQLESSTPIVPNVKNLEIEILEHLNAKRKALFDSLGFQSKTINAIESNLKPIKARLRNYTADEIKTVIDHLIVSWGNDASMRQYLTPASIFRASKFDGKNIAAQEWKLNGSAVGFGRTLNKQETLEAKNSEAGKAFLRKLHGGDTYEHE
ncbi:Phg_2220_C domain-containing protein [Vibrio chagasii]|nr:Phg_2220_C domain-containing protein [Vibrio chagasii]